MNEARNVPFGDVAWTDDAPGIQAKETEVDGVRWAIVEYSEGTGREKWCENGHRGFVLRGEIEYEFDNGWIPLRVSAGEAFFLLSAPLDEGAHRGRNLAPGPTRLFLIDDPISEG